MAIKTNKEDKKQSSGGKGAFSLPVTSANPPMPQVKPPKKKRDGK
jgi:hypothetical protein